MGAMVLAFALIVWQRHRIRSEWFIWQLGRTTNPAQRLGLLNKISAELGASEGTLLSAYRGNVEDVRSIAIPHLAALRDGEGLRALGELLHDDSRDIRESAALALVFDQRDAAWKVLCDAVQSEDVNAACAAAGVIGRSSREDAGCVLADAIEKNDSPRVRAQAAESLIVAIADAIQGRGPKVKGWHVRDSKVARGCGVFAVLAMAASDGGTFEGRLANERAIADVLGAARSKGVALAPNAGPSRAVPTRRVGEFVRTQLVETLGLSKAIVGGDEDTLVKALNGTLAGRGKTVTSQQAGGS